MNRATIRSRFRGENPEITERVASDDLLNGWMFDGDKDICAIAECIKSNVPEVFSSIADQQYYDLTAEIDKFYKIDEYPGGGVWYNNVPLKKATESEMNYILSNWKSASSGTPRKYFLRGKYIWFDVAPVTADVEIAISTVYVSDDFDNDADTPYNQLSYLEPFHPGIMKFLQWKVKQKVGKDQEASKAEMEYYTFAKRMKKLTSGSQNDKAFLINRSGYGHSSFNTSC